MTAPAIYTDVPTDANLTSALATGVLITEPQPSLIQKMLAVMRPIRMLAGRFITPEMYGAVGDGVTDDQTALQAALNALVPGATLYIGPGRTYAHSGQLLTPTTVNGYTIGGGGRLLATNLNNSALRVRGNNVTIQGITVEKTASTTRTDPYESQLLVCDGCQDLRLIEVEAIGGSATGMFLTRLNRFLVARCRVENTLADGIHMTGGSQNGLVLDPRVRLAGDDGVSVVSYVAGSDGGMCKFIDVINPVVLGSKAGRGVTCVGGEDIRFINIFTDDTFAAGVYIASETYGGNTIYAVARVLVSGGTVRRANRNTDPNGVAGPVDHGAVLISAQVAAYTNTDVMVENLEIFDTRPAAPWECSVMAGGGNNLRITLRNITMNGRAGNTWYLAAWNAGTNTTITRLEPWLKYTPTQTTTMA